MAKPVRVIFSAHGVPHVIAENRPDLFMAQGFVHALDRLWQMEFARRFFSGRLSEVFGPRPLLPQELPATLAQATVVDLDAFVRLMGIRQTAARSLDLLSDRIRSFLEAYSTGVNRYIETHLKRLPLEFRLLRYEPEPWRPEDCLTVGKGFALLLSTSLLTRLALTAVRHRLSGNDAKLASLYPNYPEGNPTITRAAADGSARLLYFLSGAFPGISAYGSNSWVVASSRSATGKPILCNDTHLRMTLPPVWYLMELKAVTRAPEDGFVAAGATVPGCPCVYVGHNAEIGWGITAALGDDGDLYEEKIHPEDRDSYLAGGAWRKMDRREERIAIRGGKHTTRTVRFTRHGPVISDFMTDTFANGVLAFRWTGLEAAAEFEVLYGVNEARGWSEFLASLERHVAPTLNYVYADRAGNIGYCLVGKIPVRPTLSFLPLPGWREDFEWKGYIPFAELPRVYNPPQGVIVTANNAVVDASYPYYVSALFEPPYRARRIEELLAGKKVFTVADMVAIQRDVVSLFARTTVDVLGGDLEKAAAKDPALAPLARGLKAWNGACQEQSWEAALFHVFHQRLLRNLLEPELGQHVFRAYAEVFNQCLIPLERILRQPESPWFERGSRAWFVEKSLREAAECLRDEFGAESKTWRWGELHALTLRHVFGQNDALAPFFSLGPVPSPGDGTTINMGFYSHADPYHPIVGPSLRMILDAANWRDSKFVLVSGQSGHPFSAHYRDQFPLWQAGEFISFLPNAEAISGAAALALVPERC
ncbi:MAG TPA: penicillin acylase family protein [Candidatus Acidoferrales bacterium]|nr:penicillin acylase family protein [Candidatus Acidoferrales bacterium]